VLTESRGFRDYPGQKVPRLKIEGWKKRFITPLEGGGKKNEVVPRVRNLGREAERGGATEENVDHLCSESVQLNGAELTTQSGR